MRVSVPTTPATPPVCVAGFDPMAAIIGAILALAIAGGARWLGLDRDRAFYPTVMMVIASYYVLFALVGGADVLVPETGICLGFVVLAGIGFKRSAWFVVAALVAHGAFDLVHPHAVKNAGVPAWWPGFCSAYDVTAGVLLGLREFAATNRWRARTNRARPSREHRVGAGTHRAG